MHNYFCRFNDLPRKDELNFSLSVIEKLIKNNQKNNEITDFTLLEYAFNLNI